MLVESMTSNDSISTSLSHGRSATDSTQQKRFRAGSISGRLRTASDLEESGFIDKNQKGIIKDLIISGDTKLQEALDKFEKGDVKELSDMIKQGLLERKESIDILENLDFDFLNVAQPRRDRFNSLDDRRMSFSLGLDDNIGPDSDLGYLDIGKAQRSGSICDPNLSHVFNEDFEKEVGRRARNSSLDSTNSFKIFDYWNGGLDVQDSNEMPSTAYPFGGAPGSGNRVVQAFTKKAEPTNVDMSAYTAVARSLQMTGSRPATASVSSANRQKPAISHITPTITMTTKEKPSTTSIMSPQFSLSVITSSSGVPSVTKHSDNPENKGVLGAYTVDQRRKRIDKFLEKRSRRVWTKKVKYDVRKNFADSRLRVKGRFVKKEDEHIMREMLDA